MYGLIVITIFTLNTHPVIEDLKVFNSKELCLSELNKVYNEKEKLQFNYPAKVEYQMIKNQKVMIFKYKTDYNKQETTSYYQCKKMEQDF